MLFSSLFPLLTVTTPHAQQPTVFGLNEMALNTIGLVGSMLAGWLPSVIGPWLNVSSQSTLAYRVVLLIGVVILTSSALPLLGNLPAAPHLDDEGVPIVAAAPMRTNWRIIQYGIAGFLIGMGSGTFFPFQSLFLRSQFDLSDASVGTVLAFGGVALGIGAVAAGHFFGERNLRVWSSIFRIAAAPALLMMLAPVVWVAVAGFILRALLIGCSISLNDVLTMRLVNPQQRGFSSSIGNMTWAAGWAITATLSGYVQTSYGFTPLLILGALAYVLSGLAIWWFERDEVDGVVV
jgi:predicted MFS family arabinose efflux permease